LIRKQITQESKNLSILLSTSGNHSLQASVHICPLRRAKAATYFLFDFAGRKSRSARLLVKGTPSTKAKAKTAFFLYALFVLPPISFLLWATPDERTVCDTQRCRVVCGCFR